MDQTQPIDRLTMFLYFLMRDHVPIGTINLVLNRVDMIDDIADLRPALLQVAKDERDRILDG